MEIPEAPPPRNRCESAAILVLLSLFAISACRAETPVSTPTLAVVKALPATGFARGVVYSSWDGSYRSETAWRADLKHFKSLGVTDIQVMTFAHQPAVDQSRILPSDESKWPKAFIGAARKQGFRILLKPHVWSRQFYDGSKRWRGSIKMADVATWAAWFSQYEVFILREARLAQAAGVERLSIGLEYVEATRGHSPQWRALITKVRAVYSGELTYSADGNHEMAHIDFWDALDFIGINAYFKLSELDRPGQAAIGKGWAPYVARLKALSAKYGKRIEFTEAGYPSIVGAARTPWRWPDKTDSSDLALQAELFEGLFRVCAGGKWCGGLFFWKYYERPEKTPHELDYEPRGKPGEQVISRWYRAR